MSVQIFLSYARADDRLPPGGTDGKGFVTFLLDQLDYEFVDLGKPWPKIWRDTRSIERGDQFDPIIDAAIQQSGLFVVVLSPNWMESDYCNKELESFRRRWQQEGEMGVKQRIVIAGKRFVDRGKRPSLLQGQEGFDFFDFEGPGMTGFQIDFFYRGAIRDKRYEKLVQEFSRYLYRRAQEIVRPKSVLPTLAPPVQEAPPQVKVNAGARKIYLAKPASDMRQAYSRLVEELSRNGYAIAPDPSTEIPDDNTAKEFIDNALAGAEAAIHLLGVRAGYAPERSDPIVKLQLSQAENMILETSDGGLSPRLRRIIWAPEVVEDASSANGDHPPSAPEAVASPTKRLPQDVLAKFGSFLPTDKLLGSSLSKFVEFLVDHLQQSEAAAVPIAEVADDDWVYVYHAPPDAKYAGDLVEALRQHGIAGCLPALEGEPAEVIRIHQERLLECGAVVLCWAQASEAWTHARAHEFKDWKKLGRQKRFAYRGLLAGPPPGDRKTSFVKYPPPNEIDLIINLTDDDRPLAQAVDKFVQPIRQHGQ